MFIYSSFKALYYPTVLGSCRRFKYTILKLVFVGTFNKHVSVVTLAISNNIQNMLISNIYTPMFAYMTHMLGLFLDLC